jgi:hypothetical protein
MAAVEGMGNRWMIGRHPTRDVGTREHSARVVTVDDIRAIVADLPRAYEALVADRVKFRVGRYVFLALSRDETLMGFAFPKDERADLVASDPDRFLMPLPSDERYNWVRARLSALDVGELRELVVEAWAMCVPKRVAEPVLAELSARQARAARAGSRGSSSSGTPRSSGTCRR